MESEKKKLLFIDDEKDFLGICKKFFELKNFKVYTATRGNTGLETAKTENPDLIIMDIRMPESNGIEVLKQLRRFNKDVKVIMLTGFGTAENLQDSSNLGISDFLSKPFDLDTLLSIVNETLTN
jgi:DNA-binding response OmpR family regulator